LQNDFPMNGAVRKLPAPSVGKCGEVAEWLKALVC